MARPRARTNAARRAATGLLGKRAGRAVSIALCAALALGSFAGCASADAPAGRTSLGDDAASSRPTLTVYLDITNYGTWFEQLRARFPEIDFQETVIRSNDAAAEMSRRIEHGDTPDIILTNNLNRSVPNITEGLMDLSGKEYTTAYMTSFLNAANIDGGIYYLPSQIATLGLAYNKTLFEEQGWSVPDSFESLVASCDTVAEAGLKPAVITFGEDYAADAFYRLLMLDVGYKLEGSAWLERFNNQEAALADVDLTAVFDDYEALAAAGALSPDNELITDNWVTYNGSATREIGYIESYGTFTNTVPGARQGDSFEMLPCYGSANDQGYLFATPQVYVAAGAQVENTDKEALVDEVLAFIASEEGQRSIMGITNSVTSPVLGVSDAVDDPFLAGVGTLLAEERLLTVPTFDHSNDVLNDMLKKLIAGETTREEVIAAVDEANAAATAESVAEPEPALAFATADFSYEQTTGLILDAFRAEAGCDFTLAYYVPEGDQGKQKSCCAGKLYQGPVTDTDAVRISAYHGSAMQDQVVDRLTMTGRQLLEALEYEDTLYYTGLSVRYRWDNERGAYRAADLLDADGNVLDPDASYTVAMLSNMDLGQALYTSREGTGIHACDALKSHLDRCGTVAPEQVMVNDAVEER